MASAQQTTGGHEENGTCDFPALARQAADRIERLPGEVRASFADSCPSRRAARLSQASNRILLEVAPVVGWIERRKHPGAAELVKRRLYCVLDEAVACAECDIPEYEGGIIHRTEGRPSAGGERAEIMLVTARLVAKSFREWATEIESAETQCRAAMKAAKEALGGRGKGEEGGRPPAPTDPPLSERGRLVLTALLNKKAFDSDHRIATAEIAVKAAGKSADPNQYKEVLVELKGRGYVDTKEGRGGGCWLTASGRTRAEKL